jgi:hypothetical protein
MTAWGHEAKSSGLHALSASKSIPDMTRTPYGARRVRSGPESGEPARWSQRQDTVKGGRLAEHVCGKNGSKLAVHIGCFTPRPRIRSGHS